MLTSTDLLETKPERPRGAKILLIVGLILLVIGIVAAKSGIDSFRQGVTRIRNKGPEVRNSVLATVKVPGSGKVDLEPGRYDVFALSDYGGFRGPRTSTTSSTSTSTTSTTTVAPPVTDRGTGSGGGTGATSGRPVGIDEPTVRLIDPDGRELVAEQPGIGSVFGAATGEMYAVSTYQVVESGTYRLEAKGGNAARVGIAPAISDDEATHLVVVGLGVGMGFLSGGLGVLFLIIGGVWWAVGSRKRPPPIWTGPMGPGGPGWGPGPGPGAGPGWGAGSTAGWPGMVPPGSFPPDAWVPPAQPGWATPPPAAYPGPATGGWRPAPQDPPPGAAWPGPPPPPGGGPEPSGPTGPAPAAPPTPPPWGHAPPTSDP